MAAHQGAEFSESHAHSVHSLVTNQEMYLYQNILELTLIDAYALKGWVVATPNKFYPGFHYLGPHVTE